MRNKGFNASYFKSSVDKQKELFNVVNHDPHQEVARKLGISGMAVGKCVERGKETFDKSELMREYLS